MANIFRKWMRDDDAVAAMEAGLIFPIMIALLIGVIDVGKALTLYQKVSGASAMMVDLLTREEDVSDAELADIIAAGHLVMEPYDENQMGYDIVGIQFTGGGASPSVIWRDTLNMPENAEAVSGAAGLGEENEGVVAVTVRYEYVPYFLDYVFGTFEMEELFYARGRKSSFVTRS